MNRKTLLRIAGLILLLAGFYELISAGSIGAVASCGLAIECYSIDAFPPLEIGIGLVTSGVIAILVAAAIGKSPGD